MSSQSQEDSLLASDEESPALPPIRPAEAAQLRRALDSIFPSAYIEAHLADGPLFQARLEPQQQRQQRQRPLSAANDQAKWHASSEPSTRSQLGDLARALDSCLRLESARPVGLCAARRALYDQLFDELIRQVTVGCTERGLLLVRVRNELRLTMGYYRRAYESAVAYGASRALDNKLELEQCRQLLGDQLTGGPSRHRPTMDAGSREGAKSTESMELNDLIERTNRHFESELAKKDLIIKRQRELIEALTQKSIEQIKSPQQQQL